MTSRCRPVLHHILSTYAQNQGGSSRTDTTDTLGTSPSSPSRASLVEESEPLRTPSCIESPLRILRRSVVVRQCSSYLRRGLPRPRYSILTGSPNVLELRSLAYRLRLTLPPLPHRSQYFCTSSEADPKIMHANHHPGQRTVLHTTLYFLRVSFIPSIGGFKRRAART